VSEGKPKKKKPSPQELREALVQKQREGAPAPEDPLSAKNLRAMGIRLGIPVLVGWVVAFAISGWIPKAIAAVLTAVLAGLVLFSLRLAKRTMGVADLLRGASTKEARKEALEKLEKDYKKDDAQAIFGKAQIELQEDPRKALATLEQIKLDKNPQLADEARVQRAMIHLAYGETDEARALADKVDPSKQKDDARRATYVCILAEAFARTGAAKRAGEMLDLLDAKVAEGDDIKPLALRARAFAQAWSNQTKQMRATLRTTAGINPQLLSYFVTKRKGGMASRGIHPMLEKEAIELLTKTGQVQRKMEFRRR